MITRNFDNIMKVLFIGSNTVLSSVSADETTWQSGGIGIYKDSNGDFWRCRGLSMLASGLFGGTDDKFTQPENQLTPTMAIGSNNAEESYDDYTISVISDVAVPNARGNTFTYDVEKATMTMLKSFVNNTENDIAVNEIGLYARIVGIKQGSSTDISRPVLMFREKLDEPVVLAANGGTATFTATLNLPVANKPNE